MTLIFNIYFFLSLGVIISSSFVVFSFNPIYSLLWLVLAFLFSTSMLLVFNSEFLALMFLIVYIGAIAVLFLFAVMLLDFKVKSFKSQKNKSFFSLFLLSCFLLIYLISLNKTKNNYFVVNLDNNNFKSVIYFILFLVDKTYLIFLNWSDILNSFNEIEVFSILLYDIFILQFLLVGFILLVVLLGVIYLTNSYQSVKILDQSIFKQISTNSNLFYK